MRNIFAFVCVVISLLGCGGGGGNPGACSGSVEYCTRYEAQAASNINIPATVSPTQVSKLCGVDVGANILRGSVTDVHDGDTLTLNASGLTHKIRLDSIDAPELAQPFGNASQTSLANAVLGKSVQVAYSKQDQYGRTVGAVFTDTCQYVNLNQVATGMAWFYKAYQCEVSAAVRSHFAQAQDVAVAAKLGLWSQSAPEAPWFYRNGVEPVTPICSSELPTWSDTLALTAVGSTSTANSSSTVTISNGTSTATCYTGPRGGTYTITANGNKNYGGC
jgi:endonuclease YncB( thermonuclease family)